MSWLARLLRRTPAADDKTDLSCSFCGRHRREVRKLVAGPSVTICDDCVGLSEQILEDEVEQAGEPSYFVDAILTAVTHLGRRAAYARTRPRLRAVIELGRRHRLVLRRVMEVAVAIDDLDTAAAALRAIGAADRLPIDGIDLAALLIDLGHHDEALIALAAVDVRVLEGVEAILHALHDVEARVARGADTATIAALRGRITDLAPAVAELEAGPLADALHARRLGAMTLAAVAAGAFDAAEQAARARLTRRPDSPAAHDHLARVLVARADHAGAAAIRAAGLALAHPEGVFASRLAPSATTAPFR